MSEITDAFSELYAVQTAVVGSALTATFAVAGAVAVVVGTGTFDEAIYGGGTGETGDIEFQALASDFDDVQPVKFSAVTYNSVARKVFNVRESHGVYIIAAGDPVVL